MWGISLDVDFKGDFVIIDEAPLWISHILKRKPISSYQFEKELENL